MTPLHTTTYNTLHQYGFSGIIVNSYNSLPGPLTPPCPALAVLRFGSCMGRVWEEGDHNLKMLTSLVPRHLSEKIEFSEKGLGTRLDANYSRSLSSVTAHDG